MKNKYVFVTILLFAVAVMGVLLSFASGRTQKSADNKQITVVTSFYPMYIAAMNLVDGMDQVKLENLSEPQTGCLHDFQLVPEDMKLLSKADVFIINGGGMESFLTEVASQYPNLTIIDTSEGIPQEGENAHFWMSVTDYSEQVQNMENGLLDLKGIDAETLRDNSDAYVTKLDQLVQQEKAMLPLTQNVNTISFHEAFEYLAKDLDMNVPYTLDLDEERQVSAGEVSEVLSEINKNKISLVLAEELYGSGMGETVMKETNAKVYYLDSLVRGDYDKNRYLDGMKSNLNMIKAALGGQ